jgi:hypothetical protein
MRLPISLITLAALAISAGAASVATASTTASSRGERFTLSGATIRGVDSPLRVTAIGPIAGSGTVQDKDGAARHDTLVFHLAKGTVTLSADEKSIVAHPDFHTCTVKIVAQGTFTITGGTGAFHAANGNGTFTRHTSIIGGRNSSGACLPKSAPPKAVYNTVTMTGKASVPSA